LAFSYSIDIFSDDYFVLSQCARLTDRRADRQTNFDSNSAVTEIDAR